GRVTYFLRAPLFFGMDIFALKAGNSKSYLAEFPDSTISTNSSHLYCVPMLCPVLFFLSRFPGLPLLQVIPDPFPLHSVILILGNHAGAVSQEENKNNEQDYHHRDQYLHKPHTLPMYHGGSPAT